MHIECNCTTAINHILIPRAVLRIVLISLTKLQVAFRYFFIAGQKHSRPKDVRLITPLS